MNRDQIFAKVTDIFRDVLDNDDITLNDNTVASEVDGWDSINYIPIIATIEKSFKIKFSSNEIHRFKNVGEMINSIDSKLSA